MESWIRRLNFRRRVSKAQVEAARTLELRGQRFLVEFGFDNCCEKALAILEAEGWPWR